MKLRHLRERRARRRPGHLQLARGANRVPLALGDHRDHVFLVDHTRAGYGGDRRLVDGGRAAARGRRSQHARVQHALDLDLGDVLEPAVHFLGDDLLRDRPADHAVLGRILDRRLPLGQERIAVLLVPLELVMKVATTDQVGIAHPALCVAGHGDDAVAHDEPVSGHAELRGGALQQ